jgi:hypothetical protein
MNPSLIITPNAQEAGKLYSIVPTDGSGDLSVTRATSATRVDENGLIEIPVTNLLLRSEEFNDAYWNKVGSYTLTPNATTAPDGTLTAELFTKTGAINTVVSIARGTLFSTTGTYTLSFYCKQNVGNIVSLRLDAAGGTCSTRFNFVTKTFINSGANFISSSYEELANGWFRLILVGNVTATDWTVDINLFFGQTGDSVYVWGAQLEASSTVGEYIPTTSVIRTKFQGITQDGGSASNIPRLDYSNGSCPNILLEPQRTNLALRSEEFDNATSWTPQNITLTANSNASPSGATNAETIADNVTLGAHNIFAAAGNRTTSTSGTTYTYSAFIKAGTRRYVGLGIGAGGSGVHMFIDTTNFTTTAAKQFGVNTNWVYLSNSITAFANGWYRCSLTFRTDAALTLIPSFFLSNVSTTLLAEPSYIGDGSDTFLWGAQLEAGAYPTSYIPTTSASVTRNIDVVQKTGVSSLIGQTEGTIYWEGTLTDGQADDIFFLNRNLMNSVFLYKSSANQIFLRIYYNIASINFGSASGYTGNVKIAAAYKSGDTILYVNGVQVGTSATAFTFTGALTDVFLNNSAYLFANATKNIKTAALFPTRLTNAQLAALTA